MNGLLAHLDLTRGLLALLLSVALFGVVQSERNPPETGSVDTPLDIVNTPPGLLIVGNPSATAVQVRVSAPRENWISMRSGAVRASVDLSRGLLGPQDYPVSVDVPDPRIRVVEAIPSRVSVHLDERLERAVPVRLQLSGTVPVGYIAGDAEIEPATVDVTGPASAVQQIESAAVELRLDGVTAPVDGRYTAAPVDVNGESISAEGRGLRLAPPAVRVRIPVSQQFASKSVGVQPVMSGSVRSGYVIEGVATEPSVVTIVGAPRVVGPATFAETERIDVTDVSSTFTRQVALLAPDGVSMLQQDVARVTVRVAPLVLMQSFATVPVPAGLPGNLQVVSSLPSVQVVFQGPAPTLQGVAAGDFRATINLEGLTAGTHRATVDVEAPSGISIQSVNPRVIAVTLGESAPVASVRRQEAA